MNETPEAKALREAIEEQQRLDAARIEEVNRQARIRLEREQNERDRRAEAERIRKAAEEE